MIKYDKPKFITFEGGEGSGKSTQSKMLYEYLLSRNIKAIHTREIGGTEEAEKIRNLLIYSELLPLSELMLVMGARYEHINKVIIPGLVDGYWVICDRFIDSTACYQSGDTNLTIEDIFDLHNRLMLISYDKETEEILKPKINMSEYGQKAIMPDLTFFMDIPPDIGLQRVLSRGEINKFEEKNYDFHQIIYNRFKTIATMYNERINTIDCVNKSIKEIHQLVLARIFH